MRLSLIQTSLKELSPLTILPLWKNTQEEQDDIPQTHPHHSPSNSYNNEIMAKWAGGASRLQELTSYFDQLGISGHGLVRAAEAAPIVGMIVGALWDLHDAAVNAKGNRSNVQQLDAFGQDILRMFEFRGRGGDVGVMGLYMY